MDWHQYFMSMVHLCAMKSRDPSSKIGAVVVGPDRAIRSTGYNGLPRGVEYAPGRDEKPEKYYWYEHAERNSVFNAARIGVSTLGCTMYVNVMPCADCARAIINSGIREVVVWERRPDEADTMKPRWGDSMDRAREMMKEAGVALAVYTGPVITEIHGFVSGRKLDLKT